jgi:hypothetical protein
MVQVTLNWSFPDDITPEKVLLMYTYPGYTSTLFFAGDVTTYQFNAPPGVHVCVMLWGCKSGVRITPAGTCEFTVPEQ